MSSVCVAQKDRVSGELARSILLFPDCRTHCSDGTVSNTEITVLPPKSHRCEPMGFCQPVLQASFHHFLQSKHVPSRAAPPGSSGGPLEGVELPCGALRAQDALGQQPIAVLSCLFSGLSFLISVNCNLHSFTT